MAILVLLSVSSIWISPTSQTAPNQAVKSDSLHQDGVWLRAIFGNFDSKSNSSKTAVPSGQMNLKGTGFASGDSLKVRVIWSGIDSADGDEDVLVVTAAVPDASNWKPIFKGDRPFSCHACAPLIGVHQLKKSDGRWVVVASSVAVTTAGGWGEPPKDIRLVRIGAGKVAVEIRDTWGGGGITEVGLQLLAEWRGRWREVFTGRLAEDDRGTCGHDRDLGELPCYAYKKRLLFASHAGSSYDDIVISQIGTYLDDNSKVHKVSGTERFAFRAGKYTKVSQTGAIVPGSE